MCRILLVGAGILVGSLLWAQAPSSPLPEETRIYLQDGKVLYGHLHNSPEADTVELVMAGGSFLRIPQTRIDSIRLGAGRFQQFYQDRNDIRPVRYPSHGMYHRLEVGSTFYRQEIRPWVPTAVSPSISYSIGTRWGNRISTGWGLGLQRNIVGMMIPVFVETTGDLISGRHALVYTSQIGTGLSISNARFVERWGAGLYGKLGLGWHIHSRGPAAWRFNLQYSFQQVSAQTDCFDDCPGFRFQTVRTWFNGFTYGVGIEFGGRE
ncbi:MAG: hypothetical protein AAFV07_04085 [Bacteroidota bacterium]